MKKFAYRVDLILTAIGGGETKSADWDVIESDVELTEEEVKENYRKQGFTPRTPHRLVVSRIRHPDRIPKMMSLLSEYWSKYPDQQFNQLVMNLQYEYAKTNSNYLKAYWERDEVRRDLHAYQKVEIPDLFFVEDDRFIEFLEMKLRGE